MTKVDNGRSAKPKINLAYSLEYTAVLFNALQAVNNFYGTGSRVNLEYRERFNSLYRSHDKSSEYRQFVSHFKMDDLAEERHNPLAITAKDDYLRRLQQFSNDFDSHLNAINPTFKRFIFPACQWLSNLFNQNVLLENTRYFKPIADFQTLKDLKTDINKSISRVVKHTKNRELYDLIYKIHPVDLFHMDKPDVKNNSTQTAAIEMQQPTKEKYPEFSPKAKRKISHMQRFKNKFFHDQKKETKTVYEGEPDTTMTI